MGKLPSFFVFPCLFCQSHVFFLPRNRRSTGGELHLLGDCSFLKEHTIGINLYEYMHITEMHLTSFSVDGTKDTQFKMTHLLPDTSSVVLQKMA
jgi:hypothetical protein